MAVAAEEKGKHAESSACRLLCSQRMAGAAAASALCMCAAVLPSPPPSKTEASTREHSLLTAQRPPKLITRSITSLNNKAKKQPREMRDVSFRLQHAALAGARAARSHADHLPSS